MSALHPTNSQVVSFLFQSFWKWTLETEMHLTHHFWNAARKLLPRWGCILNNLDLWCTTHSLWKTFFTELLNKTFRREDTSTNCITNSLQVAEDNQIVSVSQFSHLETAQTYRSYRGLLKHNLLMLTQQSRIAGWKGKEKCIVLYWQTTNLL